VIQPDQFPDNLFAPAKRTTLMEDGVNPIYDKEIRSEIFSHGTLMLRVVIQVSILLALPVMGFCLFLQAQYTPWYIAYVLLFNMLVGPVFSAGSVTSERERQTLELLLTTVILPWEILSGKLIAGLRVSSVLTLFLVWPVLLAALFIGENHGFWTTFVAYLGIILLTCVTTATLALFCSVVFHKTSHSLLASYLLILILFCLPLAVNFFASRFHPDAPLTPYLGWTGISSPLATTFALPLQTVGASVGAAPTIDPWAILAGYGAFTVSLMVVLGSLMIWLFQRRWRVVE
jgi:ABC-type Na+ efflux pump permease subunit